MDARLIAISLEPCRLVDKMRTANKILFHYIPTYLLTLTVTESKVEAYKSLFHVV